MKMFMCGAILALVSVGFANAQGSSAPKDDMAAVSNTNWLFVQTADSVTSDGKTITLRGAAPQTIMFSDRPDRITGDASTKSFVAMWDKGKNSFQKDPPNATLSAVVKGKVQTAVVELMDPKLSGNDLTYTIKVLDGEVPQDGDTPSLFIDWWRAGPGWGWRRAWGPGWGCRRGPYGGLHCW